jgi:hypothetical protein
MHTKLSFVLVACMLVSAAFVSRVAFAQPRAADQTLGMALLSASVAGNGTLIRGAGVALVSKTGTGEYFVTFGRSIANCTCTASPGDSSGQAHFITGMATANCPNGAANQVRIRTANPGVTGGSTPADISFQLVVFCPK